MNCTIVKTTLLRRASEAVAESSELPNISVELVEMVDRRSAVAEALGAIFLLPVTALAQNLTYNLTVVCLELGKSHALSFANSSVRKEDVSNVVASHVSPIVPISRG